MLKYKRGFTLIELLIAIVVIAILAAISVVAYNGIQQRAYASAAATTIDGYVKILEMYAVEHGQYPAASYACLAPEGALAANNEFAADECDSGYGDTVSPILNASLQPYVSQLPNGELPAVDYEGSGGKSRAPVYDGYAEGGRIYYYLNGDYSCPRGEKDSWRDGTTVCTVWVGEVGGSGGEGGVD